MKNKKCYEIQAAEMKRLKTAKKCTRSDKIINKEVKHLLSYRKDVIMVTHRNRIDSGLNLISRGQTKDDGRTGN
jgi:hypothetical protein